MAEATVEVVVTAAAVTVEEAAAAALVVTACPTLAPALKSKIGVS